MRSTSTERLPPNEQRIDDAQTDLKLTEVDLEKRELEYKRDVLDRQASMALDQLERRRAELAPATVVSNYHSNEIDAAVDLLLARMRDLGWSRNQLASAAGLTLKRTREILAGESPTVTELYRLAKALDLEVSPIELSRRPDPEPEIPIPSLLPAVREPA
jgi:lambda repressor-like predicted transcriptional regulator